MGMFPAYIMGSYVAGIKRNILTYQRINYNEWNIISHRKKLGGEGVGKEKKKTERQLLGVSISSW